MKTNIATISAIACMLLVNCQNRAPLTPGAPAGPTVGLVGDSLNFLVATTDPESDSVRYRADWGIAIGEWTGLFASAESCIVGYRWKERGIYAVRVQAQDVHGGLSDWSAGHAVSIESICRR
jgi:hypothetical protein